MYFYMYKVYFYKNVKKLNDLFIKQQKNCLDDNFFFKNVNIFLVFCLLCLILKMVLN